MSITPYVRDAFPASLREHIGEKSVYAQALKGSLFNCREKCQVYG